MRRGDPLDRPENFLALLSHRPYAQVPENEQDTQSGRLAFQLVSLKLRSLSTS